MNKKNILEEDIILYNGITMPKFGLGTSNLLGQECYETILTALNHGYRHFDTAESYGNEEEIGRAITDFLKQNKNVQRKDLFITSKIWPNHQQYHDAQNAFNNILQRLQTTYLDLCLIHWPEEYSPECWKLLQDMYQQKLVRAIGVSNFTIKHLNAFMTMHEIKPMVNQIEIHPGHNQNEVIEFCQKNDIAVISWRTMMGKDCQRYELINKLADKYNTQPQNICLKWAWQKNLAVIPKTKHEDRIVQNYKIQNFNLTAEEMKDIDYLPEHWSQMTPLENLKWMKHFRK